jgi:nucleoside-diphosphate-sugar epimerase
MSLHVIVGAGPVGSAVARLLVEQGQQVRLVTRSGRGPAHEAIELVAADATDADRLTALTEGAAALYNCANPLYHQWLTDWPPLAASLLAAAGRTGAVHATAAPLYGYGPVTGPITPATPLAATHPKLRMRADMWRAALAAHRAGRIRATEVRASDYIEVNGVLNFALGQPILAGRRAYVPIPLDVPHTFTAISDVARTLVRAAADERAWGEAWLVPSVAPLTVRQLGTEFARVVGAPKPRLSRMPYPALWAAGLFSTAAKEMRTTYYQWAKPFVMDSTLTERTFGLAPTPLEVSLAAADVEAVNPSLTPRR